MDNQFNKDVSIPVDEVMLKGQLFFPDKAKAIIVFSHGSGSSRFSSRNQMVAKYLQAKDFGTLLFDLLTEEEDKNYNNRFDISLLTKRLVDVTNWLEAHFHKGEDFSIGYFGASTGAASALKAAARLPQIKAVVSRGGRPDLAMDELYKVKAPTLLIVGSRDYDVLQVNRKAYEQLECEKKVEVVEGATHLFEEKGTMEKVCELSAEWFIEYLQHVKQIK
jgi:dienelactone hydrolase